MNNGERNTGAIKKSPGSRSIEKGRDFRKQYLRAHKILLDVYKEKLFKPRSLARSDNLDLDTVARQRESDNDSFFIFRSIVYVCVFTARTTCVYTSGLRDYRFGHIHSNSPHYRDEVYEKDDGIYIYCPPRVKQFIMRMTVVD